MAISMRDSTSLNRMLPDPSDYIKNYHISASSASLTVTSQLTMGSVPPADFDIGDVAEDLDQLI